MSSLVPVDLNCTTAARVPPSSTHVAVVAVVVFPRTDHDPQRLNGAFGVEIRESNRNFDWIIWL